MDQDLALSLSLFRRKRSRGDGRGRFYAERSRIAAYGNTFEGNRGLQPQIHGLFIFFAINEKSIDAYCNNRASKPRIRDFGSDIMMRNRFKYLKRETSHVCSLFYSRQGSGHLDNR